MSGRVANLLVEKLQAADERNRYRIVGDTSTRSRWVSTLIVSDLCAQIISLNRYGLTGLSLAVVEGLFALAGAVRKALRATTRRAARKDVEKSGASFLTTIGSAAQSPRDYSYDEQLGAETSTPRPAQSRCRIAPTKARP
jgi:hypothetical protein